MSAPSPTAPGGPFPRTVTCAWCSNRYVSAVPPDLDKGTQGCNCASDVRLLDGHWTVVCGYGSENDMDTLRFVANPPSAPTDPICDECIRERLLCGDLVRIEERRDPWQGFELTGKGAAESDAEGVPIATSGTISTLAADVVAAGGTLPYPGAVADASATPEEIAATSELAGLRELRKRVEDRVRHLKHVGPCKWCSDRAQDLADLLDDLP